MNYKEKYENAVSKIKSIIADKKKQGLTNCLFEGDLNEIFPELKGNEDERIRKEIIEFLQLPHQQFVGERNQEKWIEWLQKQSEQNSTPKFKVGDWVVYETNEWREVLQIETIESERYTFTNGSSSSFDEEQYMRLWTIEDAKDGDVLDADGAPFIYKKHNKYCVYFYCGVNLTDEFVETDGTDTWSNNDKVYPATKEQCDLLFSKMKESGYEWDAEKKELKKIEKIDEKHKVGEYFTGLIPCWVNAPSTQQPAHKYHGKNIVAIHLKDGGYRCCCIDDKEAVTFSLPENTSLVEGWKRKSVEWSDEDEKMRTFINDNLCYIPDVIWESYNVTKSEALAWIEKQNEKPHWKPTEEQIQTLKDTINHDAAYTRVDVLESLINDLKKL